MPTLQATPHGPRVTVDALDVSHVSWSDDTTGTSTDFRIWYNRGSSAQGFGPAWSLVPRTGDLYSSSTGLDSSGGAIHLTYSLTGVNGVRDRYYTWSSAPAINTPTATPTSTLTRTPRPTYTPGGPTACPIQFTDVDASNPFYAYIRCLACRGIVSGYSTSPPCASAPLLPARHQRHPRPDGQVRRQRRRLLPTPIPSTQQTFTDVPPSSPFWIYVERAALHGVISGYTSSPPCTTGVPCFLPGNNVTRGQTAKFVSQAAGYSDPIPSTQQTFTDVPPSSPFWVYRRAGVRCMG